MFKTTPKRTLSKTSGLRPPSDFPSLPPSSFLTLPTPAPALDPNVDTDETVPEPLVITNFSSKKALRRRRRKALLLHPFTAPHHTKHNGRRHLTFVGTITKHHHARRLLSFIGAVNGRPARILIDGGAEGNVISSAFCKNNTVTLTPSTPIPIVLPNGSSTLSHNQASFLLERQGYENNVSAIVYNLQKYDLILGKPWLTEINPIIDWRTNSLRFMHNNTPVFWDCAGFDKPLSKTCQTISALHLVTIASDPDNAVFLAQVKIPRPSPVDGPDLPEEVREIVKVEFPDVFPTELPDGLPPDRGDSMRIETDPFADPPVRPVIRMSIAELDELKKQLTGLLKKGLISPSTSPYGAPVLFVKKKDGTLRMCVDYRGLNKITRKNRHPLPRIDELIDRFRTARYFTKLDLLSGYHQMRVHPDDTHKTAFRTRYGHYEFNVVPFGLTNAPAAFSTMMRTVMDPVLDKCLVLYLDDILIYSDNKKDHLRDIRRVLTLLRKAGLYCKLSKCSFMQDETEFLGHIISKDGLKTNAGLVKAIREWPVPSTQRHVMQFLGLTNFYHQYIDHYADLALPLTALLGSDTPFVWTQAQQGAFEALKTAVTTAPVLRIFDPALSTAVETDASGFAIGAVLFQIDSNGVSRPVAFTSRKLSQAEQNYPTHEQELLAVVHALKTWRYYLDGSHFIVYTDHATLQHFPTQPNLTRRQARWMELMQEYDFVFKYKPGKDNIVPDALSRRPDHKVSDPTPCQINSMNISLDPGIRQRLIECYPVDPVLSSLYESCRQASPSDRHFVFDDLLWINIKGTTRLCIPSDTKLRSTLLHDSHDSPLAGHLGSDKTYHNMRRTFYWPRMARDVKRYVASCEQCQRNKPQLQPPAGLFKPLDIPSQRWDTISMDFIVKLPKTARAFDAITVFVDKLSKQVHFCASHTTDSAADVARLFFDQIFRLHGMPRAIISDRDTRFTGKFWAKLTELMGTKLNMSTAYHPQSDGQTERANRTLEEMLRSYVSYNQKDWDLLLPMMEFAYNNSVNPSTGYSPFFLNYGHDPLIPTSLLKPPATNVPSVSDFVDSQATALAHAHDAIIDAQNRQKAQADKSRRPITFAVGDMVFLSAENISAASHANRPSKKLEPKYLGPYKILEQLNDNAFKLDLPSTMRHHPVFNADLLKPYTASPPEFEHRTPPRPPPELVEGEEEYEVERILDFRMFGRTPKWLVAWKGYTMDDCTWEPKSSLRNAKTAMADFEASRKDG